MTEPLLTVSGLKKYYEVRKGIWDRFRRKEEIVKAVDDISFSVYSGETFGLVGESGCGKSTTGRALLRLIEPSAGQIHFDGVELTGLGEEDLRKKRRDMQIVFQDPYSSLDPRHSVGQILEEPLKVHRMGEAAARKARVEELMDVVGLSYAHIRRYPHQFSGGQRQRIGIARALALQPKLMLLDEPVSALDVSIQSQVVNLLQDLQEQFGLTYIFIAHDLSVVKHICDRVAVMYLGRIVELADKNSLFGNPQHPYTQALLSSVPDADPFVKKERLVLTGEVPSPSNAPAGCAFHTRCPHVMRVCHEVRPALTERGNGHFSACHLYDQN
ncbi:dipeptide ABC transporter ATP-binding protein [Paenibacillus sp. Marseille-Q4541]|uniref:ABC transporter ATP-binding protein n=1 Tax=Paenibacillus sp. Marseille-Q4541 TaxID=2831522 RepID=UPI001BAB6D91|nr:dipeptide ABC transporter ATP-binding protein [Paenibacillus sp. Marseille-Q4541]